MSPETYRPVAGGDSPVIAFMVVGFPGSAIQVEVDYSATVSQLKVLLRSQEPRLQDQDSVKLFLAKSNGSWLSQGSDDVLTARARRRDAQCEVATAGHRD